MVTGFVTFCAAEPEQMIALRQISSQITAGPRERRRAELAKLTSFITDGQQHGELGTLDPELSAGRLLARPHAVPEQVMRRPEAVEQIGRDLTLFLAAGSPGPDPGSSAGSSARSVTARPVAVRAAGVIARQP